MPEERLVPEMTFPSDNAATNYVRSVSGGNEPHHVGVILRTTPRFAEGIHRDTGIDIRRLSFNLVQLPGTRAGQDSLRVDGVSPSRHGRGGHLFSYGARSNNGFWREVQNRIIGMSRTDAANYVVRAMAAANLAAANGQFLPNWAGTGLLPWEVDARNRAWLANLDAHVNSASVAAFVQKVNAFAPDGLATPLTSLAAYSDLQRGKLFAAEPALFERYPLSAADVPLAHQGDWTPDMRSRAARWKANATVLGVAGLAGGFTLIGAALDTAYAYDLYLDSAALAAQGDTYGANRTWAMFLGEVYGGALGGAVGAALGAPVGGFGALATSWALGSIGAQWFSDRAGDWYDTNAKFRGFVDGIANGARDVLGTSDVQLAAAIARQTPQAIMALLRGDDVFVFRDQNNQPVLSVVYDPTEQRIYVRSDRTGFTAWVETSVDAIAGEFGAFIREEFGEWLAEQGWASSLINSATEAWSTLSESVGEDGSFFWQAKSLDLQRDAKFRGYVEVYDEDGVTLLSTGRQLTFSNDGPQIAGFIPGGSAFERNLEFLQLIVTDVATGEVLSEEASARQNGVGVSFGALGSIFGSNLAKLIQTDDPWAALGIGTVLGTIGLNIGQGIDNVRDGAADTSFADAFNDLPQDLLGAGLGAVGSYLFAEFLEDAGVTGTVGEVANSLAGAAIGQIADNIAYNLLHPNSQVNVFQGTNPLASPSLYLNAFGSFLGVKLASSLIKFDTIGGQIGASLGSGVGSLVALASMKDGAFLGFKFFGFAGPVAAFIGAFLGYILGGLIGSLFGGSPKAGASLDWNGREFAVGHVWSKNGGSKDAMRSIAGQVGELLNGVIAATGSRVLDPGGVETGSYAVKKRTYGYGQQRDRSLVFNSGDPADIINHGAYIALHDLSERLIGGDVYIKRALNATLQHAGGNRNATQGAYAAGAFEANTLFGNIATAQDYASYLQNAGVINALIAAEPASAFTAGWTITFARVMELGLDRRWKSDWLGGWAAFLDETADGKLDGNAFAPGNVFLELDPTTNERLFVFVDGDGSLLGVLGDTIDSASKDVIAGTVGADTLTVNADTIALTSALTLNGVAATAGNHKIRVAALLDGGAGDDVIRGGDLGNDLLGGEGNDVLIGGRLDDWAFGGAGDDRLYAGNIADPNASVDVLTGVDGGNGDYLDGGEGNDSLYGGKGSDWLAGGAGVDALYGGDGGDILDGGEGDDRGAAGEARLLGGAGSDNYVFYYGGGADVVFDEANAQAPGSNLYGLRARYQAIAANTIQRNWAGNGQYEADGSVVGGEDAISFGPGIDFRNLVLKRSGTQAAPGADLIIELTAFDAQGARVWSGDSLTIKDWFDEGRRVEWLRFANGEEIRIGDLSSFIIGTAAADVVIGTYGSDFMLGEDGDDRLYGLAGNDFGFGGRGKDLVAGDENNDWVLGGDDDDQVIGGQGNDTAFGDAGNDSVYGGDGDDIMAGGRGNDIVVGGAGSDLFKYARGDGRDVVFDAHVDNWELVMDVTLGAGNEFVNGYQLVNGQVIKNGTVYFDNSAWIGLYDWRNAQGKLYRHLGANGAGMTTADLGEDTLEFGLGIDIEDIQVRRIGDDLVLGVSVGAHDARAFADIGDQVTLREWFRAGAQIEKFVFAEIGALDATAFSISAAGASDGDDVLSGSNARDWITGGLGNDTIDGGAGDDVLAGNFGGDTVRGGAGVDVLYGGADDDVLDGGAGADQLFGGAGLDIASYASNTGVGVGIRVSLASTGSNTLDAAGDVFSSIEGLEGTARADHLSGDSGDNVLIGGEGDDTLQGGVGDDAYDYVVGDGADVIRDRQVAIQQILDTSGALNTQEFSANWQLLGVEEMWGGNWYCYQLTVTRISDGAIIYQSRPNVDFLYATPQTMPSGAAWPFANGQWLLGAGRTGNGVETVLEQAQAGNAGDDALELGAGLSLADIAATREGQNLRLAFIQGGSVLIENQANADNAIETLILADGLSASLAHLKLAGEAGTASDDLFLGSTSADTFAGGEGDDVISGAAGDDTLSGAAGDDTFEGGAGADVIDGGADSVTATHGARAGDALGAYGDTARYVGSGAGVAIDLAAGTASGGDATGDTLIEIENLIGSAHADTLRGDGDANQLAGLGGNDTLEGRAGDDVLIGGAGNDALSGGDGADNIAGDVGNDAIDAGTGNDLIAGGDGDDAIQAGAGDDIADGGLGADALSGGDDKDQLSGGEGADQIFGDAGDDTLHGGVGDDVLEGGAGNDRLAGAEGADILRGGVGDDAYVIDLASGHDSIIDSEGINTIAIAGAAFDKIWLSRVGDDLRIGAIGTPEFSATLKDYFAASNASSARSIAVGDRVLYLGHAGALISAMSAQSTNAPASMPSAVASMLATYWHQEGKAAPQVGGEQTLATDEDVPLSGLVAAINHDDQTLSYALDVAPTQGTVALNAATGAWVFTPAANWSGATSFVVRVTDTDGLSATQRVNVTVNPVNDAPTDLILNPSNAIVVERDRIGADPTPAAILLGSLAGIDPDAAYGGANADLVYAVTDPRFEILNGNELYLKAGAMADLDYETSPSVSVSVTVRDQGGTGLSFARTLTFNLTDRDDVLIGTSLVDTLVGQAGRDRLYGEAGDDSLSGGVGDDDLFGGAGNDALAGGEGGDLLDGGDDADTLLGGAGADILIGGAGDDVLEGGAGDDVLEGGAGADVLSYASSAAGVNLNLATGALTGGDAQGDTLGDAFERVLGSGHADTITGTTAAEIIDGGAGNDAIQGGGGQDLIYGGAGADALEGGADTDTIYGNDGDDTIIGGAGADLLYGDAGNDIIYAQGGGDLLEGGTGNDVLDGDVGSDAYVFDVNSGHDIIRDFDPDGSDSDKINFQGVDTARLWFERVGDNLKISIIGADASVTIEGWYLGTPPGNRRIEFQITSQNYSIDADALAALMATKPKPADIAALNTLMADSVYASLWANHWGVNQAPVLGAVSGQTTNEDVAIVVPLSATDDFTDAPHLRYEVRAFNDVGLTQQNTSALSGWSVTGAAGAQSLSLNPALNVSGTFYVQVKVFDLTDRVSEQVFTLQIAPVADGVTLAADASFSGTFDGGAITFDAGVALKDIDGSESYETLRLENVPPGVSVVGAINLGGGQWDLRGLTPAQLATLTLTAPATFADTLNLTLRAVTRDGTSLSTAQTRSININVNARPTNITAPTLTIAENSANGASVGSLAGVDPDNDALTYALIDNAGGRFALNTTTGALTVANAGLLNFEAASSHQVVVRVTDPSGLSYQKTFTINVGDVNEAPSLAAMSFSVAENAANGTNVGSAAGAYSDPDIASINRDPRYAFVLAGGATSQTDASGRFLIDTTTGAITVNGALDAETQASYNVTIRARDQAGAGLFADRAVIIAITNVNEAADMNWGAVTVASSATWSAATQTLAIREDTLAGLQVVVADLNATDVDTPSANLRYELTDNAGGRFVINDITGQISLVSALNFEASPNSFVLGVRVWDGGAVGVGLSTAGIVNVQTVDINEAQRIVALTNYSWSEPTPTRESVYTAMRYKWVAFTMSADPDTAPGFQYPVSFVRAVGVSNLASGWTAQISNGGAGITFTSSLGEIRTAGLGGPQGTARPYFFYEYHQGTLNQRPPAHTLIVEVVDTAGAVTQAQINVTAMSAVSLVAPVVLDLDGDGVELVSVESSPTMFDQDRDGIVDQTGWVSSDDAMLVLDRDGNGSIDDASEISFSGDSGAAVSDIEGLRAYDTNGNGFFDVGDAQFAQFQVWQDANQDGVSQAVELSTLTHRGIVAIGLSLSLTGQQVVGAQDNLLYGTTTYLRADGTSGTAGDVFLAHTTVVVDIVAPAGPDQLPPIVFDLDGGGFFMTSRRESNVMFDADNNGVRQRTGWFGAGEGVLALDRNGDGMIGSGAEISFTQDLVGARTDLEGLAAYDSNANGFFDLGDARFGEFRIWQDVNQDGVSQAGELRSLAEWNIQAVNLTPRSTGASTDGMTDNTIVATSEFVRNDGSRSAIADVFLSYDEDAGPRGAGGDIGGVNRTAANGARRPRGVDRNRSNGADWINDNAIDADGDQRVRDWLERHSVWGGRERPWAKALAGIENDEGARASQSAEPQEQLGDQLRRQVAPASALHRRLGAADARVLHMVNAMAGFGARDAADLARTAKKRDPRVAEMLTSLPDLR